MCDYADVPNEKEIAGKLLDDIIALFRFWHTVIYLWYEFGF